MKKKVLLLALIDYGLYESIKENLEWNGFEVTLVLHAGYPFKYKNLGERVRNLSRKIFLKDYDYKKKLRANFIEEQQANIINENDFYDYCIVIRSDFFSTDILKAAKRKSKLFVSYHYDGLGRSKGVFDRIELFDRFFVFDKHDVDQYPKYKLELTDNFYFDCYPQRVQQQESRKKVYFLGTYHPSREDELLQYYDVLFQNNLQVDIDLLINTLFPAQSELHKHGGIRLLTEVIPYKAYLERISSYHILLDLLISEHQGLSFRVFEGLYYQKKVITNNKYVRERDFYHPNNYFVVENNDFSGLSEFLEAPYVDIDPKIVEKYSFTSWVNQLLNTRN